MIVVNSVTTGPLRATIQLQLPFEGNHNAEIAPSENELDTPAIKVCISLSHPLFKIHANCSERVFNRPSQKYFE